MDTRITAIGFSRASDNNLGEFDRGAYDEAVKLTNFGVRVEMSIMWLGTGVLKTPKKGSFWGVKKGVKKGVKNPPFWDPEFVQIAQPD